MRPCVPATGAPWTLRITTGPQLQPRTSNQTRSILRGIMDKYAPELLLLRLKRRRDDDQQCGHFPPAKRAVQTPLPSFNFMGLPAG
jgi:hypothetical protein